MLKPKNPLFRMFDLLGEDILRSGSPSINKASEEASRLKFFELYSEYPTNKINKNIVIFE